MHRRVMQGGSRPRRRLVGWASLVALTCLVAACTSGGPTNPTSAAIDSGQIDPETTIGSGAQSADSTVSPAPVPPGLESFYGQSLEWGSCAPFAGSTSQQNYYRSPVLECARLQVPLDYQEPDGDTINLAVVRVPARDPSARIGSVIFDPGGPGGSGVDAVAQFGAFGLAGDLRSSFDLVGFDPRGVGASQPVIECRTDAERDTQRANVIRTRTQQEIDAANELARQIAENCAARSGAELGIEGATLLANVSTRDVARDLDILRAAVGDPRLNYVGFSYGTSIGAAYAAQFPDNVRAMILDGAVDPNADPAADLLGQAEGFQQAFDDFAAWCARERPDCVLGANPADATAVYQSLVRPLLDRPVALDDGRVLSFSDAITGTIQALYATAFWDSLAAALLGLSQGRGDALMALADQYEGRDASGRYSPVQDAFMAISCIDGSQATGDAMTDELIAKYVAASPFQDSGDPPRATRAPCDFWVAPPVPAPDLGDLAGLPEVLVISTTGDPATPYQAGVDLAQALGARLLTVEGTNHTAYISIGNTCVDTAGTKYLTTLELPPEGTVC